MGGGEATLQLGEVREIAGGLDVAGSAMLCLERRRCKASPLDRNTGPRTGAWRRGSEKV